MRLHLIALGVFGLSMSLAAACATARADGNDSAKSIEMIPGQLPARASKLRAPQAQLFVEQKEAPGASKTSLRLESAPRLSNKSKD
jgi:hypothetical protein